MRESREEVEERGGGKVLCRFNTWFEYATFVHQPGAIPLFESDNRDIG